MSAPCVAISFSSCLVKLVSNHWRNVFELIRIFGSPLGFVGLCNATRTSQAAGSGEASSRPYLGEGDHPAWQGREPNRKVGIPPKMPKGSLDDARGKALKKERYSVIAK